VNIFDLTLQLKGYPLKKARLVLQGLGKLDEAAFYAYVKEQRSTILNHHLKNNAFYKEFTSNSEGFDNWTDVPVMTKKHLQQPLTNRLSKGFTPENCYVNKISGSSGDPFIFAKDKFIHALTWAIIQQRFGWYGIDFNSSLQARFYGIPLDFWGYSTEKIKDYLSQRMRFSVFDLSDKAFGKYLENFVTEPFEYINGYTSAVVQFAKFLKHRKLHLKTICPTLKVCVVTSEMLFDSDKELMESVFGVQVTLNHCTITHPILWQCAIKDIRICKTTKAVY
jgi:phenylacetate-CoA ligase